MGRRTFSRRITSAPIIQMASEGMEYGPKRESAARFRQITGARGPPCAASVTAHFVFHVDCQIIIEMDQKSIGRGTEDLMGFDIPSCILRLEAGWRYWFECHSRVL